MLTNEIADLNRAIQTQTLSAEAKSAWFILSDLIENGSYLITRQIPAGLTQIQFKNLSSFMQKNKLLTQSVLTQMSPISPPLGRYLAKAYENYLEQENINAVRGEIGMNRRASSHLRQLELRVARLEKLRLL
jgi:hypothetical protein